MFNPTVFTFETFLTSTDTKPIVAALQAVLSPENPMSMCTVYAATGNGKTHLMRAVVKAATAQQSSAAYVRAGEIPFPAKELLVPDVLSIDDFDAMPANPQPDQDTALANVIEDRVLSGKKTFIAAELKVKASALAGFPRTTARLAWGPRFVVPGPDQTVLEQLVQSIAKSFSSTLTNEQLSELAALLCGHDMRTAIQLSMTVMVYVQHDGDFQGAMQQIRPKLTPSTSIPFDDIVAAVSGRLGVSVAVIRGQRRNRDAVRARHTAVYLARELNKHESLVNIARYFGRDHASIIHAITAIKNKMKQDEFLRKDIDQLNTELRVQSGFAWSKSPKEPDNDNRSETADRADRDQL